MRAKNESAAPCGNTGGAGIETHFDESDDTNIHQSQQPIHRIKVKPDAVALIDATDRHLVAEYDWRRGGDNNSYAVALVSDGGTIRTIYLHRLVMGAAPGELVDHRDGDRLNCRRENLRIVDRAENGANIRSTTNPTGYRNVFWFPKRKRFQARVQRQGGTYRGPYRTTADEAAKDADMLLRGIYPGLVRLNFPHPHELPILRRASAGGDQ